MCDCIYCINAHTNIHTCMDVSTAHTLYIVCLHCVYMPYVCALLKRLCNVGAQIIDLMMLVIDITKGIQTQTAEVHCTYITYSCTYVFYCTCTHVSCL